MTTSDIAVGKSKPKTHEKEIIARWEALKKHGLTDEPDTVVCNTIYDIVLDKLDEYLKAGICDAMLHISFDSRNQVVTITYGNKVHFLKSKCSSSIQQKLHTKFQDAGFNSLYDRNKSHTNNTGGCIFTPYIIIRPQSFVQKHSTAICVDIEKKQSKGTPSNNVNKD